MFSYKCWIGVHWFQWLVKHFFLFAFKYYMGEVKQRRTRANTSLNKSPLNVLCHVTMKIIFFSWYIGECTTICRQDARNLLRRSYSHPHSKSWYIQWQTMRNKLLFNTHDTRSDSWWEQWSFDYLGTQTRQAQYLTRIY